MTKNARLFEQYCVKDGYNLDFRDVEGQTILEIMDSIGGGIKTRIVIIFDDSDSMISIYGVDIVSGISDSKNNELLKLVNKLNSNYTFYKFILDENAVQINAFISVENNFSPSILMNYILGMYRIIENEYSTLMKVIWS